MKRLILVFACVFLTCAGQVHAQSNRSADAVVTIGPEESGNWRVEYSFAKPQSTLVFARSSNDYRDATWSLISDNARFGRASGVDVIVFDEPAREVSFSIIPLTSELQGDYTPFVPFKDGSIAVHTGQFSLVSFDALETLRQAKEAGEPTDLGAAPLVMDVKLSSDRKLIAGGETYQGTLTHRITGDGTYIYMGQGELQAFEGFDAVLDTTLPAWLGEQFSGQVMARVIDAYEANWGRALEERPMLMLAYKGGRAEGLSVTGGAVGDMLMMEVGGAGLNDPDSDTLAYLHWFFAHEVAHLFQSRGALRFDDDRDAWIHEGAANTMSYTQIASMLDGEGGQTFLAGVYGNAFEECVSALEDGPLASVRERGAFSAHYSCGDFVALATDGFLRRRDLYSFWGTLTERALDLETPHIDANLYFTTLQLLGATQGQRNLMQAIVGEEAPDNPRKALTEMLEAAGLAPKFNAEGQLISMDWPDYSAE